MDREDICNSQVRINDPGTEGADINARICAAPSTLVGPRLAWNLKMMGVMRDGILPFQGYMHFENPSQMLGRNGLHLATLSPRFQRSVANRIR